MATEQEKKKRKEEEERRRRNDSGTSYDSYSYTPGYSDTTPNDNCGSSDSGSSGGGCD